MKCGGAGDTYVVTYANTEATRAAVVGSIDRFFGQERDEEDFVELLEGSTSAQQISETSLDIYLRATESFTELVASAKMKDYVIDINIYQYVLLNYIFKLLDNYLNRYKLTWNRLVGFEMIKYNVKCLHYYDDAINILNIKNSLAVKKLLKLLHIRKNVAYDIFKFLCTTEKKILHKAVCNMNIYRH